VVLAPHVRSREILVVLQRRWEHVVFCGYSGLLIHHVDIHQNVVWHQEFVVYLIRSGDVHALALFQSN